MLGLLWFFGWLVVLLVVLGLFSEGSKYGAV
jgi:hypothetical protein